ncbi:arsenite efflux membrane protein ArsB [Enhydrobacter aerosaccus]|uniref:Arsenite efflux membrane protein ArsB n=1 Tax=Enhydrobacter aerosaccus TaxID=225324 RepID=A0A1T4T312_9HYPH|nr:arsenite efflux membrane protein ArsB [Enhydrobacter aerosaccus]
MAIWAIAAIATAGVIVRPFGAPEAIWAVLGAGLLVLAGLISPGDALVGIGKGTDVYLFLIGMMLLAETARAEGLFDWMAAHATRRARGSASRMFTLVYAVGTLVTIFLSNDATAVVLTPAVAAAARTARVKHPLPYLLICAFIANAASFVLPISNPANLVLYGSHAPALLDWLPRYLPASVVSIVVTYGILRWTQRKALAQPIAADVPVPRLSRTGMAAAAGIVVTGIVLLAASALDSQLGLPTAIAGVATTALVLLSARKAPWQTLKDISWSVLPLVAGLFVLVEALARTGLIGLLGEALHHAAAQSVASTSWAVGVLVAIASNLMNNLPVGLIAGSVVSSAGLSDQVTQAALIGVDLGPNLSVTGSLATILWLTALRREAHHVSAFTFLKLGLLVMPPALLLALAVALLPCWT